MNSKLKNLLKHQSLLSEKIALQRASLEEIILPWQKPLSYLDRTIAAMRYVKEHPVFILGSLALLAKNRPTRLGGLLWVAWSATKSIKNLAESISK